MASFGKASRDMLLKVHPDLKRLFEEVVKHWDCTIVYGHRSVAEQKVLYAQGRTKPGSIVTNMDGIVKKSMHNYLPSLAIDVAPWPIQWHNVDEFYAFSGAVLITARRLGINVRSGLNWDGDRAYRDQTLFDGPHYELIL